MESRTEPQPAEGCYGLVRGLSALVMVLFSTALVPLGLLYLRINGPDWMRGEPVPPELLFSAGGVALVGIIAAMWLAGAFANCVDSDDDEDDEDDEDASDE